MAVSPARRTRRSEACGFLRCVAHTIIAAPDCSGHANGRASIGGMPGKNKTGTAAILQRLICYSCVGSTGAAGEEPIMKTFSFIIFATLPLWPVAAAAQLNVVISGGFSSAYEQLLPEFERMSGIKVTTGSGASQGTGPQTIAAQLARGVPANVVILSREGLSELIAANRIAAGTEVDLARVPLGVAVRSGSPKPDVGTVEAFK